MLMMRAKRDESKVFFAWEKRRGLRALLARAPTRKGLVVAGGVGAFLFLREREHVAAEVRATRAEIGATSTAVAAWRADHDLACPASLGELVSAGYLHGVPRDAWGRPLRMSCPGRHDPKGFDVSSDGPDGVPGGTDRVQ
jgi:general secretion pathway protein G